MENSHQRLKSWDSQFTSERNSVENKPASSTIVSLDRALTEEVSCCNEWNTSFA